MNVCVHSMPDFDGLLCEDPAQLSWLNHASHLRLLIIGIFFKKEIR